MKYLVEPTNGSILLAYSMLLSYPKSYSPTLILKGGNCRTVTMKCGVSWQREKRGWALKLILESNPDDIFCMILDMLLTFLCFSLLICEMGTVMSLLFHSLVVGKSH